MDVLEYAYLSIISIALSLYLQLVNCIQTFFTDILREPCRYPSDRVSHLALHWLMIAPYCLCSGHDSGVSHSCDGALLGWIVDYESLQDIDQMMETYPLRSSGYAWKSFPTKEDQYMGE